MYLKLITVRFEHSMFLGVAIGRFVGLPILFSVVFLQKQGYMQLHSYLYKTRLIQRIAFSVRKFAYSVMVFIQSISHTYNANRVTWISLRNTQFSNGTAIRCTLIKSSP